MGRSCVSNLASHSPLEGLAAISDPGGVLPGVVLSERSGLALATILTRKGQQEALRVRVHEIFGVAIPITPRRVATEAIAFIWTGPGHWLAIAESEKGHLFEARLRDGLASLASISDQSDGRIVFRISGSKARAALAKSLPLDLHPRAFAPGTSASTAANHIGIQIWQLDDIPSYEVAVFRSYSLSFWQALVRSSAEFGVAHSRAAERSRGVA
jgi:heterotetrameric sarcosine oxidase gamma subunit